MVAKYIHATFELDLFFFFSWTDENWGHDCYQPDKSDSEAAKKAVEMAKTDGKAKAGWKIWKAVDKFFS